MTRRVPRLAVPAAGLLALAVLAGCGAPAADAPSVPVAPSPASSPPVVEPSTGPAEPSTAPAEPSTAPSPEPGQPAACAASVRRAVEETIDGQFAAFAIPDFPAAYGYASRGFRSSMDVEVFALVIDTDFPMILEATGHAVEDCRQPAPGTVVAVVSVSGADGRTFEMVYRLLLEGVDWRVDGAGNPVERITA